MMGGIHNFLLGEKESMCLQPLLWGFKMFLNGKTMLNKTEYFYKVLTMSGWELLYSGQN